MPDNLDELQEKAPPHDIEAEQAVLGAMMIERKATAMGISMVSVDDFYPEVHRLIFAAMVTIDRANTPVDLVTLAAELRRTSQLEICGGGDYLTALIGKVPTAAHIGRYAKIVADKSRARKLIRAGAEIQALGYADPEEPAAAVSAATQKLLLLEETRGGGGLRPLPDVAWETYGRLVKEVALPWSIRGPRFGIPELDKTMGGLGNHLLTIIEGDTSFGKSSLCRQLAYCTAKSLDESEGKVLIYILEDTEDFWMTFSAGRLSGLKGSRLKRGANLNTDEERKLREAHTELMSLDNVMITDDSRYQNIADLIASARLQALRGGVACIIIDHVQMLSAPGVTGEPMYVEIMSRLLSLAKDLRASIILPSQVTHHEQESYSKYCKAIEEFSVATLQIIRAPEKPELTKAQRRNEEDCLIEVKKDRLGPAGYTVEVTNDTAMGTWFGREDSMAYEGPQQEW